MVPTGAKTTHTPTTSVTDDLVFAGHATKHGSHVGCDTVLDETGWVGLSRGQDSHEGKVGTGP